MRIGTRGSTLALAQARLVAGLLDGRPGGPHPPAELVTIATSGDGIPAHPGADRNSAGADAGRAGRDCQPGDDRGGEAPGSGLDVGGHAAGGDKSRWVHELERALSAGEIDLAVHSAKDVPGGLADGLTLLGAPARAAPEDVLCMGRSPLEPDEPGAPPGGLERLPSGTRVGTSSVRRAAQLHAARQDLEVVSVGGNVDTRLRKLGEGGLDALVLARAGLQRLGRETEAAAVLDPARFVPSPGQGTLALEGRAEDERTREAVAAITDERAFACLRAERAVAHALGASCNTPLGALALDYGCGCLHLRAWVGLSDGSAWVSDELLGGFYDPEQLGRRVAERLLSAGAGELLTDLEIDRSRGTRASGAGQFGDASGASVTLIGPRFGPDRGAVR